MKTFIWIFAAIGAVSASTSHAANYGCQAKANPHRGFTADFSISLRPAAVGGKIMLKTGSRQQVLGVVSEAGSLDRADPSQREAFEMTLGLVSEEDVSGVAAADIDRVSSLQIFRAEGTDGDEVVVMRLLDGARQIGGTILISGKGTACLPR